jgi:hypothetical protein
MAAGFLPSSVYSSAKPGCNGNSPIFRISGNATAFAQFFRRFSVIFTKGVIVRTFSERRARSTGRGALLFVLT